MTNGEKYKDEIVKHIKDDSLSIEDNSYCDFIKSKILLYVTESPFDTSL